VRFSFFLLPILYLAIGGYVTAMLLQRGLFNASPAWLLFVVPMLAMTVLLTVVGIVNVWLRYRTWSEETLFRQYSNRSLLWLYLRGWGVVMLGLTVGVLFAIVYQVLPDYLQELTGCLSYLFYALDALLTLVALLSIVLGENLEEIRLRNAQSENQLLKAQLNPHFLYNTLNNIDALIWLDQERASIAVTNLSSLMRYMTYSGRQERVSIGEEISAIQQICELQRLRFPSADVLTFETEVHDRDYTLPPLLLIPLVENCFKHCGATTEPGAIQICLDVDASQLQFTTDNNLPITDTPKENINNGLGLTVLRRRLDLLFPDRCTFSAQREGDRFKTRLTISG